MLPLHHYSLRSTCMIHVTGGHPQHSRCCKVFMQTHLHANAVVFNAFAHFTSFPTIFAPLALTPVLHGVPGSTSYFLASGCCMVFLDLHPTSLCLAVVLHCVPRSTSYFLVSACCAFLQVVEGARCCHGRGKVRTALSPVGCVEAVY